MFGWRNDKRKNINLLWQEIKYGLHNCNVYQSIAILILISFETFQVPLSNKNIFFYVVNAEPIPIN